MLLQNSSKNCQHGSGKGRVDGEIKMRLRLGRGVVAGMSKIAKVKGWPTKIADAAGHSLVICTTIGFGIFCLTVFTGLAIIMSNTIVEFVCR